MQRREFITLFGGTAAGWPLVARAQQPDKAYRIAFVSPSRPVSDMIETNPLFATLFNELRRLGYVDGKNLVFLRFSAEGDAARYDPIIRDVVNASPDVIITANTPLVLRFKALVHSIPVVAMMGDPIARGVVTRSPSR
jgi:putative ABC transport system substrate-binding protein